MMIMQRSDSVFGFTADEYEVAGILLELPRLFAECKWPFFSWGLKRKRSTPDSVPTASAPPPPSPPSPLPSLSLTPSLSPPPPVPPASVAETEKVTFKAEATSPATPLSFSPSESDERPKRLKRKHTIKKTREELLLDVNTQLQDREVLLKEIENLRSYVKDLQATNLSLKTRQQKLDAGIKCGEESQSEWEAKRRWSSVDMTQGVVSVNPAAPIDHQDPRSEMRLRIDQQQQQQTMMMMMRAEAEMVVSNSCSSSGGEAYPQWRPPMMNNVVPRGIPDLNTFPAESFLMESGNLFSDLKRIKAAEARRRRMQICRDKNSSSTKPRLSFATR